MNIPPFNESESAHNHFPNTNHGGANAATNAPNGALLAAEDGGAAPDEPPCSGHSPVNHTLKHDRRQLEAIEVGAQSPPSPSAESTTSSASSITIAQGVAATGTPAAVQEISNAHLLPVDAVCAQLGTHPKAGLASAAVEDRQRQFGLNQLTDPSRVSALNILARQVFNALTLVLIGALVLSFAVKDWVEGAVVCAVIVINVGLAFVQEWKAERTMASLRKIASPTAQVFRSGHDGSITIAAVDLVPGDIVELSTGDIVPADLRLISVNGLEIEESALTGESVPVSKLVQALVFPSQVVSNSKSEGEAADAAMTHDVPLADRVNCAFASTMVTTGRATGVVIATANDTQVGQIAAQMRLGSAATRKAADGDDNANGNAFVGRLRRIGAKILHGLGKFFGLNVGTPLQRRMNKFAFLLLGLALVCAIIVFGVAKFDIDDQVVLYAIALGIGVIPESLTAVLTITFSVGAKRMAEKNVIVRRLEALEALGSCSMIASDKTGTLTEGKMVVRECWLPGAVDEDGQSLELTLSADGTGSISNTTTGNASPTTQAIGPDVLSVGLRAMATVASLCNVAQIAVKAETTTPPAQGQKDSPAPATRGNPTEIALALFATALGMSKEKLIGKSSGSSTEPAFGLPADFSRTSSPMKEKNDVRIRSVEVPVSTPAAYVELGEYPFDGTIKRMTSVYRPTTFSPHNTDDVSQVYFMKGAVERVLLACSNTVVNDGDAKGRDFALLPTRELDERTKEAILARMETMASKGLRVLALAQRFDTASVSSSFPDQKADKVIDEGIPTKALQLSTGVESVAEAYKLPAREEVEQGFTFLGLVALRDPPRPETRPSVEACRRAGITVCMVTGDHPSTARQIALDVAILRGNEGPGAVMEARQFDALSDAEVDKLAELPLVIARCSPNTKVRLVEAAARRGKFLAMTGDGINDAPALKRSPIGIGMGQNGTAVARDSSDIVLQDDNFSSIVAAIKAGRTIFDNIQRFLISLLVANVGEVILLLGGLGFRDAQGESVFPLSPLQILFTNAVVASLPAVGLGLEPAERGSMRRHPDQFASGVFSRAVIVDMLVYGCVMGVTCLLTFIAMMYGVGQAQFGIGCNENASPECDAVFQARSATFVALIMQNLFLAWELISMHRSFFAMKPWRHLARNPLLLGSVIFGLVLIPICLYVPGFNDRVFRHGPLRGEGWGIALAAVVVFVLALEGWKWAAREGGWPWLTEVSGGLQMRIPPAVDGEDDEEEEEDEGRSVEEKESGRRQSVERMA
ncbi:unnamed protein product [Tilletia controversa]|uniref:Cation-transporting P-type ATPase N-terminal domain-containing protein n=3 Tax=Tilletia TaxID=13289 RepID=A0A8X7MR77_9BASI|nr:hypothetical protein CF328_g4036 [Tilletia controversa]KAE8201414.1 hypothetical protein CF335_g3743 [Tilletia laevis]CAD6893511.1 unnamed protein product [Tilletia caries]KAE8246418.1 hypothetical protein A4X06_0g5023 [Tilletia controversa]CAD6901869.1 unnamed protein product [Tilletia laevis]